MIKRNLYGEAALFRLDRASAHMLATKAHGIAAAQARIEQNVEPHTLPRAEP